MTFTRTEQPGNLCSGVNRSIILAYVEGVEENYENLRVLLELLQLDQLGFVVAADLKLVNVYYAPRPGERSEAGQGAFYFSPHSDPYQVTTG